MLSDVFKEELIVHESGLRFRPPTIGEGKFSGSTYCWGQMLDNPEFTDIGGFRRAVDKLDTVKEQSVYRYYEDGEFHKIPDQKAIVSGKNDLTYAVLGKDYVPVQDKEVFGTFADVCDINGMTKIYGRIDDQYTGRVKANIVFANPDFVVTLLHNYNYPVMLGYQVYNSHNGDTKFGSKAIGISMVCVNYNMWGDLLAQFSMKHSSRARNSVEMFQKQIIELLNGIPALQDLVQAAHNEIIMIDEVEDLLWAIDLPKTGIEQIVGSPSLFCSEIKELGLTAWTLYNSVTGYITYRSGSGRYLQKTEDLSENAVRLLIEKQDALVTEGREKHKIAVEKAAIKVVA